MVQWTLHSCQNKQIFSWQMTNSGPSDNMTDRGGADTFSSVLLTCARPRIGSENVNESVILMRTGTLSGMGCESVAPLPRCNGRSTVGWRFPAGMQIWSAIGISPWTLSEASACTWTHTMRQMAVRQKTVLCIKLKFRKCNCTEIQLNITKTETE